jgi:hypothetical protein
MREFTPIDDDLKAIAHDHYRHPHPIVQRKMEVLWLKSHGLPHQQIANLAGVSLRTVQRYLDDYHQGGLPLLRRCSWRALRRCCAGTNASWKSTSGTTRRGVPRRPPRSSGSRRGCAAG